MTLQEQMAEMMRNIEAVTGIPKHYAFSGRQCGKTAFQTEALRRKAEAMRGANKNNDAYDAAAFAAFGYDPAAGVKWERKSRTKAQGKLEMLPFSCSQVGETVHLMGPGVHIRACSWSVASWASERLNRQHCDGQRTFEILEIEATLIVGQRHLPDNQITNPSPNEH